MEITGSPDQKQVSVRPEFRRPELNETKTRDRQRNGPNRTRTAAVRLNFGLTKGLAQKGTRSRPEKTRTRVNRTRSYKVREKSGNLKSQGSFSVIRQTGFKS